MKSILLSVKPKRVAKILNGEKTIEIRIKFPTDYVGWVYIYCTKGKLNLIHEEDYNEEKQIWEKSKYYLVDYGDKYSLNGKVVARFWCDKVEEIKFDDKKVQAKSCLTEEELFDYLFINEPYHEDMSKGYAINITKLEIFDRPKQIGEFKTIHKYKTCDDCSHFDDDNYLYCNKCEETKPLIKAPTNYCYVVELLC